MQLEGTLVQRLNAYYAEPGTPGYDAMILLDRAALDHAPKPPCRGAGLTALKNARRRPGRMRGLASRRSTPHRGQGHGAHVTQVCATTTAAIPQLKSAHTGGYFVRRANFGFSGYVTLGDGIVLFGLFGFAGSLQKPQMWQARPDPDGSPGLGG